MHNPYLYVAAHLAVLLETYVGKQLRSAAAVSDDSGQLIAEFVHASSRRRA